MRRLLLSALVLTGCPTAPVTKGPEPVTTAVPDPPKDHGAPLDFALDPVDKEIDHTPESTQLLGKKAIVLVLQSYDGASLAALRTLEPLLADLPKETACLLVALQPLTDRAFIGIFFDAIKSQCRRAIGDAKRGRLGDLAKLNVVPAVIVLRKDGTLVGGFTGGFDEGQVRGLLAKAD